MGLISWIRQRFFRKKNCCHHYRKHWSRAYGSYGGYVRRCTKCNKIEQ
nr:MAG TPA: Halobacterial output domain 2 [Caudoviricetes sp.]